MLFVVAALALFAPAHNRSEGRSSFTLDEAGRVHVEISIGAFDIPELCDADLLTRDRPKNEAKLTKCLETSLAQLLRLKADGVACPLAYDRFDFIEAPPQAGGGTLVIKADAQCPTLPHALVIDWGLFAGGQLDHVSVASVAQPYAEPRLAMLSKRSARLTVDVKGPLAKWLIPAVAAAVALLVVIVGALALAMRRRRASVPAARTPG